jgi:hypothetical protein
MMILLRRRIPTFLMKRRSRNSSIKSRRRRWIKTCRIKRKRKKKLKILRRTRRKKKKRTRNRKKKSRFRKL